MHCSSCSVVLVFSWEPTGGVSYNGSCFCIRFYLPGVGVGFRVQLGFRVWHSGIIVVDSKLTI